MATPAAPQAASCDYCDDLHPKGGLECPGRRVGQVIAGKYRVDQILGIGGFGAVYAAEHLSLGRAVALKILPPRYAADGGPGGRFARGPGAGAGLGHPGVVAVRDAGVGDDGCCWMEMEHLEGRDLYRALKSDGPLPVAAAVALGLAVLDVLAAAHERGIVHRDLKSPNIFLAQSAAGVVVKLLDFGFAKIDDDQALTRPGALLGSLLYMSPEQYQNPSLVDGRTDLYALGVILFEALTGRWPVEWKSKGELRRKIMTGDLERHPRGRRADVPEWLDAVVARAMAPDLRVRFASAKDMHAALAAGGAG